MAGDPATTAPVKSGQVLAGKYKVERLLGEGGMGVVVSARHLQLGTRVAVKFLLPESCETPELVQRFIREARAAAQLQSEHVTRVMDVSTLENGAPYIVMEYLRGIDLARMLETKGSLPIAQAIDYVLQACEALAEAHALGIVHRDIKPSNLFLAERTDGTSLVKVLDFGISKSLSAGASRSARISTGTGAAFGSPLYMSPEQIRSAKAVDTRTDIWALGIVLYELLTGCAPFSADSVPGLFLAVANDAVTPMRGLRPEITPELEAVVLKCLEKDPAKRPQTVAELAKLLVPFAPGGAHVAVERTERLARRSIVNLEDADPEAPTIVPLSTSGGTPAATGGAWGGPSQSAHGARTRRKPPVYLIVGAGLCAMGVVALVIVLVTTHRSPRVDPGVAASGTTTVVIERASAAPSADSPPPSPPPAQGPAADVVVGAGPTASASATSTTKPTRPTSTKPAPAPTTTTTTTATAAPTKNKGLGLDDLH